MEVKDDEVKDNKITGTDVDAGVLYGQSGDPSMIIAEDTVVRSSPADMVTLDVDYIDIIKNQPTTNIGCTGHVSHGKSKIVERISGHKTQRHKKELERNVTINLGYANVKIWQNPISGKLVTTKSNAMTVTDPDDDEREMILIKHII